MQRYMSGFWVRYTVPKIQTYTAISAPAVTGSVYMQGFRIVAEVHPEKVAQLNFGSVQNAQIYTSSAAQTSAPAVCKVENSLNHMSHILLNFMEFAVGFWKILSDFQLAPSIA